MYDPEYGNYVRPVWVHVNHLVQAIDRCIEVARYAEAARMMLALYRVEYGSGDLRRYMDLLERLVPLYPEANEVVGFCNRAGGAYFYSGDLDRAAQFFHRVLETNDLSLKANAYSNLGITILG
jgi:tetratricopeptide (TPR) repeat protein